MHKISLDVKTLFVVIAFLICFLCLFAFQDTKYYTSDFNDPKVELYAFQSFTEPNSFHGFILGINHSYWYKNWVWQAGSEWKIEQPQILCTDLNDDQKQEIVFIFWNRLYSGTATLSENIYITDIDGNDYTIESPWDTLATLDIALTKNDTDIIINFHNHDSTTQLAYPQSMFPDIKTIDSVGFLDWVDYEIENHRLYAKIPFAIYASHAIGFIQLQYEEENGVFHIISTSYIPYHDF